jgi:hypothetical protein
MPRRSAALLSASRSASSCARKSSSWGRLIRRKALRTQQVANDCDDDHDSDWNAEGPCCHEVACLNRMPRAHITLNARQLILALYDPKSCAMVLKPSICSPDQGDQSPHQRTLRFAHHTAPAHPAGAGWFVTCEHGCSTPHVFAVRLLYSAGRPTERTRAQRIARVAKAYETRATV